MKNTDYTQHDREQLLMALLDITIGEFEEKLASFEVEDFESMSDEIDTYAGMYLGALKLGEEQPDNPKPGQLMAQAIASMSDSTLHKIVKMFGKDPLDSDTPDT